VEWFYSKSKEEWKRWLSNFAPYDRKSMFPSIESQFQALKFCYSDKPEHRYKINWRSIPSEDVRKYGSKGYFKTHKITLDVAKWEKDKILIMKQLLRISSHTTTCDFIHEVAIAT